MTYYPPYLNRGNYINPMQTGAVQQPFDFGNLSQPVYQPNQTSTDTMLWVLNENEAVAYPVAPNCNVVLWDKNKPTIYVKSVNMQGVPSIRILDFKERTETTQKTDETEKQTNNKVFVEMGDFKALQGEFEALKAKIESFDKKAIKPKRNEVENDG